MSKIEEEKNKGFTKVGGTTREKFPNNPVKKFREGP